MRNINIKIGGKAGEGVKITGLILTKALSRNDYSTFAYQEYPSLIRGGHNTYQVYASIDKAYSQVKKIDILIAFDQNTIKLHQKELSKSSLIIYDAEIIKLPFKITGKYLAIPLKKIAVKNGNRLMANTVSLGAVCGLINLPIGKLQEVLKQVVMTY